MGCISIEYLAERDALPAILAVVAENDLALHGLRAIPGQAAGPSTLYLDVGCSAYTRLSDLSGHLLGLSAVTRVVHVSTGNHLYHRRDVSVIAGKEI